MRIGFPPLGNHRSVCMPLQSQTQGRGEGVAALDNLDHQPGGGNVRIFSEKLEFRRKAKPRVDDARGAHLSRGHPRPQWERGVEITASRPSPREICMECSVRFNWGWAARRAGWTPEGVGGGGSTRCRQPRPRAGRRTGSHRPAPPPHSAGANQEETSGTIVSQRCSCTLESPCAAPRAIPEGRSVCSEI